MEVFACLRLLMDFGLLVLIWLVQLVIYPSFRHCAAESLRTWHRSYTGRISWFVVPLMFGQLFLVARELWIDPRVSQYVVGGLVVLVWVSTFASSVPMHAAIAAGRDEQGAIDRLVRGNRVRTLAWTTIFAVDLVDSGLC